MSKSYEYWETVDRMTLGKSTINLKSYIMGARYEKEEDDDQA